MNGFLLDENVSLTFQAQLEQIDPDIRVHAMGDGTAPPKGTPDPEILIWLEAQGCLLITE